MNPCHQSVCVAFTSPLASCLLFFSVRIVLSKAGDRNVRKTIGKTNEYKMRVCTEDHRGQRFIPFLKTSEASFLGYM